MSRFQNYLEIDNIFEDICTILKYNKTIDEMVSLPKTFTMVEKLAKKFGLKATKTTSLISYLSKAEESVVDLFNALCYYLIASSGNERKEALILVKSELKSVKKSDIMAFLLDVDKTMFGLSSILRSVLQGVFGIDIGHIKDWKTDIDYIITHLKKIKEVLMKTEPNEEELLAFDNFYSSVLNASGMNEDDGTGEGVADVNGAYAMSKGTTTNNIAKFWNKIGSKPARRIKKKKDMKHLL